MVYTVSRRRQNIDLIGSDTRDLQESSHGSVRNGLKDSIFTNHLVSSLVALILVAEISAITFGPPLQEIITLTKRARKKPTKRGGDQGGKTV